MKSNGFTLVELSIVLVIIGLLIGGILVGQSLIESAKTNAFARQIQQFDIAISNYKIKFRGLPGDLQGDKDGIIEDSGDYGANLSYIFNNETANFWPQLSLSGFNPNQKYTSVVTGNFNSNPKLLNSPFAALDKIGTIFIFGGGGPNSYLIGDLTDLSDSNLQMIGSPLDLFSYYALKAVKNKLESPGGFAVSVNHKAGGYRPCVNTDNSCYIQLELLAQTSQ